MKKLFCLFLFILILFTLGLNPDCQKKSVPFVTVLKLQDSDVAQPQDLVITTKEKWCDFWEEVYHSPLLPCDTSKIDFKKEFVIVTALGWKPDGCYNVEISSILKSQSNTFFVFVDDLVPSYNCICTDMIVHPIQAVKVKKPIGEIRFIHKTVYLQCK